jgi:7-cyano-7-deazaguanine synthase
VLLAVDLARLGGSALTGPTPVPKGRSPAEIGQGIPVTYVPARNTVFLSLCLAWAEAAGARDIYIGVNSMDYSGYPDCRPEFIAAFADLAALATRAGDDGERFRIMTPLQHMTKADIAAEAIRLRLDPAMSWSCYDPTDDGRHCGRCDSCRLRRAGFVAAGLADPTVYAEDAD